MSESEIFKMVDGKVNISTEQLVDVEDFVRRVVNINAHKKNFEIQIQNMEQEIEYATKTIEIQKENIKRAEKSLDYAYNFIRSNHREDIILKIEKQIEEAEKIAKEQMAKQEQEFNSRK